ncbi:MAG TPA: YbaK/EbsC family protein [Thermomicrobiales bacterium]|nr:YbaK/EbsC family protein [Thermomicrobiales bacterium]
MKSPTDGAPAHLLAFLEKHSVDFEFLAPGVPMPTVLAAAAAIGVSPESVLKTLLFAGVNGSYVVAIANGTRRVNTLLLSAASGVPQPRPARPQVVIELTGYPAGGVAPLALPDDLPVIVDVNVEALQTAYAGGGRDDLLMRVQPADIIRLNSARTARIVADDEPQRIDLVEPIATPR